MSSTNLKEPCCKVNQDAGTSNANRRRALSKTPKCLRPDDPGLIKEGCGIDGPLSATDSGQNSEVCIRSCPRTPARPHCFNPNAQRTSTAKFYTTLIKAWDNAWVFWQEVKDDRFKWGLFKSILFFTVGLKLINDLANHFGKPDKCGR